jgi:hypothetical protein
VSLFIDFKKAFDTVDPKLLHPKLFLYGFDNCALNLIANYFEGHQQSTTNQNQSEIVEYACIETWRTTRFDSRSNILSNHRRGVMYCYRGCDNFDDVSKRIQQASSVLQQWIDHNRLYMNYAKTKIMFMSPQSKLQVDIKHVQVGAESIEVGIVSDFKLLGVHLDQALSFGKMTSEFKRIVNYRLYSINHSYSIPIRTKCQFFKSFVLLHFLHSFSGTDYSINNII